MQPWNWKCWQFLGVVDRCNHQAPVVQTFDSTLHQIKICLVDSAIVFPNTYPLESDLSGGQRYPTFEHPGPDDVIQKIENTLNYTHT